MMLDNNSLFEKFAFFLVSSGAWTLLFMIVNNTVVIKNIKKKEVDDIKNRIISILHGLTSLTLTGIMLYIERREYGSPNTDFQELIMLVSGGYFFYDMIACSYYGITDAGLIIHHSMTILGYIICHIYGHGAIESLYGLFLAEISNFPMHLRMILKSLKLRHTLFYEVLEYAYMTLYTVSRTIFVGMLWIQAVPLPMVPWPLKFPMVGLWLQSQKYSYEMYKILKRRYQQYLERKEKSVELAWFKEVPEIASLSYYQREQRDKIF